MIQAVTKAKNNFAIKPRRSIRVALHSKPTPEFRALIYRVVIALSVLTIIVVCEGLVLWLVSGEAGTSIPTAVDGIYLIIINIFAETVQTSSVVGRILTLLALSQGLILATYLITVFAFFTVRGDKYMMQDHNQHFVVCGWKFQ